MKYLWDFIFGILLIGGAPWSVIGLATVIGDFLQKHIHIVTSDAVDNVVIGIINSLLSAVRLLLDFGSVYCREDLSSLKFFSALLARLFFFCFMALSYTPSLIEMLTV